MKPAILKGQEWEKKDTNRNSDTRIRVLENLSHPQSNRVTVGTVTKDGRVIRKREILTLALSNTPSGYRLVKDPDAVSLDVSSEEVKAMGSLPLWTNGRLNVDKAGTARTLYGDVIQDHDIQDLAAALRDALGAK